MLIGGKRLLPPALPSPSVPALTWSSAIAQRAAVHASRCVFEHSSEGGLGVPFKCNASCALAAAHSAPPSPPITALQHAHSGRAMERTL